MLQIWLGRRDMNISGTLEDAKDWAQYNQI
jgi:hypothetical protein